MVRWLALKSTWTTPGLGSVRAGSQLIQRLECSSFKLNTGTLLVLPHVHVAPVLNLSRWQVGDCRADMLTSEKQCRRVQITSTN